MVDLGTQTQMVNMAETLEAISKRLCKLAQLQDPKQAAYLAAFGSPDDQEWGQAFVEEYNQLVRS